MGFKGGLAAFTNAFMGTMKEMNEQKRLEAERNDARARQAKEDAYRDEQRAREKKNLDEADALKKRLAGAAAPIDVTAPQHGPEMPGQPLPEIKTGATRPRTSDEVLSETAKVYREQGNPVEAIKLDQAAEAEVLKRSVAQFNQFYAAAPNLPPQQQLAAAKQIFNSDPSLGHIENERMNPDGTFTMDIFNKKTGQRVTTTMKANDLLSGLRMHYDQAGALAQRAEEAKLLRERKGINPEHDTYDGAGNLIKRGVWKPSKYTAGGLPGAGGGAGGSGLGLNPNTGKPQDADKVYERWVKHFAEQSQLAAKDGTGEAMSPTQIYKNARDATQNELGYNQSISESAIQKRLIAERLQSHLDKKDFSSYKRDYDKLINMGTKGFTVDQLAELGFLEADRYRKDAPSDPRLIGRK